MPTRNVIVVGAGIGGVAAANRLRRLLPDGDRVTLVDKSDTHEYAPSIVWVLSGTRTPDQIRASLSRLQRRGIDVIKATVDEIDTDNRSVKTSKADLPYDKLVIALGAELAPQAMSGFEQAARNVFTPEGAEAAEGDLRRFDGGKVAVLISKLPYKCPAAPNEVALISDSLLRKRGVRDRCEVDLYSPEPFPMPTAGPEIGGTIKEMLAERGISFHDGKVAKAIDPDEKKILFEDGSEAAFDLLFAAPPHRPPEALASTGMVLESGYLEVDGKTLETKADGVYALGDCVQIPIGGGKNLPKAGVFAHGQGDVVAARIAAELKGRKAEKTFDGKGSCFVEMGGGVAAFATGQFYAQPEPALNMRRPGRHWHLAKIALEKMWLKRML